LGPVKIPLKTIKRLDKLKSRLGWQEEWIGNKEKAVKILREMSQEVRLGWSGGIWCFCSVCHDRADPAGKGASRIKPV
jgi:hypothetical protein